MKKILILAYIIIITTSPAVFAQSTGSSGNPSNNNPLPKYTLLEPLPCIPNATPAADDPCKKAGEIQTQLNFKYYVQYIFNLLIALAAVSSVFMIVYGGLQYMSTDSWQGKSDGISKVKNALLGLLLVLTSFIILRTIDPRLVAIPTALVPPLNIKYESVSAGLLEQIQRDSEYYKNQTNELAAKKIEVRNDVEVLDQKLQTLESQKGSISASDPQASEIERQILQTKKEAIIKKGELELKEDQALIVATIHQYTGSFDLEGNITETDIRTINDARKKATETYNAGINELDRLGKESLALNTGSGNLNIFEDYKKELRATYYPIYGNLLLMESNFIAEQGNPSATVETMQEVEKIAIPRTLDLQKRAELQRRYDQMVAKIRATPESE